jgi:hypothetical protein
MAQICLLVLHRIQMIIISSFKFVAISKSIRFVHHLQSFKSLISSLQTKGYFFKITKTRTVSMMVDQQKYKAYENYASANKI